jgi:hypothetical protein
MPHLIINPGSRQSHPLYKKKCRGCSDKHREKSPDKNNRNPEKHKTLSRTQQEHPRNQWIGHVASEFFSESMYIAMTMVEVTANEVEHKLIDGLSFKMQPGASYVIERKALRIIHRAQIFTNQ